jgi:hypothetical protein
MVQIPTSFKHQAKLPTKMLRPPRISCLLRRKLLLEEEGSHLVAEARVFGDRSNSKVCFKGILIWKLLFNAIRSMRLK